MRGDLRGIGKRLVVHHWYTSDDIHRSSWINVKLRVRGTKVRRDLARIFSLIECSFPEANREGTHRPRGLRLHQRDNGRRVDPARQERAERHVRQALTSDSYG